jgi:hypothetical protein
MSSLAPAAAAQAAATPSPSATPFPSPSPVVHHVVHTATHLASSFDLWGLLNTWAASVSEAAVVGAVLVIVQGLLQRFPFLQHEVAEVQYMRRFVVAVLLPFLGTAIASFASGQNTLGLAPVVFLAGQVVYAVYKRLQAPMPEPTLGPELAEEAGQG